MIPYDAGVLHNWWKLSNSFADSLTLIPVSGNMTGSVIVYGFNK
jgi:hypothetical protein